MANSFNEIFGKNLKRDCLLEHVPKHSCQIPCQIVRNVTYMIHTFAPAQIKKISLIELFPIDISPNE